MILSSLIRLRKLDSAQSKMHRTSDTESSLLESLILNIKLSAVPNTRSNTWITFSNFKL